MATFRSPEMLSGAISDLRRRITAGSGDRAAAVHLLELVAIVAEMLASKADHTRLKARDTALATANAGLTEERDDARDAEIATLRAARDAHGERVADLESEAARLRGEVARLEREGVELRKDVRHWMPASAGGEAPDRLVLTADHTRLVDTITERDGQIAALRHECDGRLLQLAAVGHVLDVTPPLFPEVRDSQRWTDFATKLPPAAQELKGRCERLAAERDEMRAEVERLKARPTNISVNWRGRYERLVEHLRAISAGDLDEQEKLAAMEERISACDPTDPLPAAPSGEVSDDGPLAVHRRDEAKLRAVRERLAKAPTMEVKADVTDPPLVDVARRALECAESWDPQARVLGNVRAADIARLCRAFMADATPPPLTDHQVAAVVQRAEPVIAAMEAGARCDKDAGLTSLHICRTCDASGWALAGVNVPPGWSRIERIDGPDSICPKCAINPSALDCLRDDGYEQAHVRPWTQPAVRDEGTRSPAREDVALTVGEALKATHVVEWRHVWKGRPQRWWQGEIGTGRVRVFGDDGEWRNWNHSPLSAEHRAHRCRLVPLADADAPPESRGPIGGAS